jgi:hypothetical protein
VCGAHDRLWMLMESMDFLGLQIESGSGCILFENLDLCTCDI